jgi:hypothetical protein
MTTKLTDFVTYNANFPVSSDARENFMNFLSAIEDRKKRDALKAAFLDLDNYNPMLFMKFFSGNRNLINEVIKELDDEIEKMKRG